MLAQIRVLPLERAHSFQQTRSLWRQNSNPEQITKAGFIREYHELTDYCSQILLTEKSIYRDSLPEPRPLGNIRQQVHFWSGHCDLCSFYTFNSCSFGSSLLPCHTSCSVFHGDIRCSYILLEWPTRTWPEGLPQLYSHHIIFHRVVSWGSIYTLATSSFSQEPV